MLILLILRRHFQNHYAKPRKTPEGFGFWGLNHMEREKERDLLGQEHRTSVERENRKSRATWKLMQWLLVEEAGGSGVWLGSGTGVG